MYYLLFFTFFVLVSNGVKAKLAPDYIKVCPGLKSDCLKKTAQEIIPLFVKGSPLLGLDSIDPLKKDYIALSLPGGFKVEFFDGALTGIRKCIIDDFQYNLSDDVADIKYHCNVTFKSKYKANGKILIITVNGNGDSKIKISNVIITARVHFHDVERDGVMYHEIKKYNVKYDVADKVTFNFTNLFTESPEFSDTVLTFLNENWKQLNDELGRPVFDELLVAVFNILIKFFSKVPKDELFAV